MAKPKRSQPADSPTLATVAGWWYHWWADAPAPEPSAAPPDAGPVAPGDDTAPEAAAAPEASVRQQEATPVDPDQKLRQRLADHLAAHAGGTSMASVAARIGVGEATLKTFLGGGRIYPKTRAAIEAYLA